MDRTFEEYDPSRQRRFVDMGSAEQAFRQHFAAPPGPLQGRFLDAFEEICAIAVEYGRKADRQLIELIAKELGRKEMLLEEVV